MAVIAENSKKNTTAENPAHITYGARETLKKLPKSSRT